MNYEYARVRYCDLDADFYSPDYQNRSVTEDHVKMVQALLWREKQTCDKKECDETMLNRPKWALRCRHIFHPECIEEYLKEKHNDIQSRWISRYRYDESIDERKAACRMIAEVFPNDEHTIKCPVPECGVIKGARHVVQPSDYKLWKAELHPTGSEFSDSFDIPKDYNGVTFISHQRRDASPEDDVVIEEGKPSFFFRVVSWFWCCGSNAGESPDKPAPNSSAGSRSSVRSRLPSVQEARSNSSRSRQRNDVGRGEPTLE